MFASYVTPEEIVTRYDVSRWGGDDWQTVLRMKIAAARMDVGEDLRQRGFDLSRLTPPLMFDALNAYATTASAGCTSASLAGGAETRFVFDCRTAEMNASVELQGSHDNVTYETLLRIDGQPLILQASEAKIYTAVFPGRYEYYRYILTANGSVTYSPFLVDTSTDNLVIYRTLMLLLLPYIGDNTAVSTLYEEMRKAYDSAMMSLRAAYDADGDGAVDTGEERGRQRVVLVR